MRGEQAGDYDRDSGLPDERKRRPIARMRMFGQRRQHGLTECLGVWNTSRPIFIEADH